MRLVKWKNASINDVSTQNLNTFVALANIYQTIRPTATVDLNISHRTMAHKCHHDTDAYNDAYDHIEDDNDHHHDNDNYDAFEEGCVVDLKSGRYHCICMIFSV